MADLVNTHLRTGSPVAQTATLLDLSRETAIAVAIDTDASTLVAASPAALEAFAIPAAHPFPVPLDSAMPALAKLRSIAAQGQQTNGAEVLIFWGPAGDIVVRSWDIETAPGEPNSRVVIARSASDAPSRHAPTSPATGGGKHPLTAQDLARLAHELKTPLTAIAAAAEVMRDERLGAMGNDRYLEYARDIHDSAAHSLAVIARLLARGEAREAERDRVETLDLNTVVARTVSTLRAIAEDRGITLSFEAGAGAPTVIASATALRQILLNLLSNALKFTPAGGDVRAMTGHLPDGAAFLKVCDSGNGIAEATLQKALALTDAPIGSQPGGGYGIGLPLVCRLVAEIGAAISFESEPGKGTAVLISF